MTDKELKKEIKERSKKMKIIKTCEHGVKNTDCHLCTSEGRVRAMRRYFEKSVKTAFEEDAKDAQSIEHKQSKRG